MKFRFIFSALLLLAGATACDERGDNSEFDFGDDFTATTNPYQNGYGRLANSLRLATYNTHRCEPLRATDNDYVDRANYNNTGMVISLMDPDVIAVQELDSISTWHPAYQLRELAQRTGMNYHYCVTRNPYRSGKYGIGLLSKEQPMAIDEVIFKHASALEDRAMIVAEFADYVFIATHFDTEEEARNAAADVVNDYVDSHFKQSTKPVYMAGDLNDARTGAEMFLRLLPKWQIISTANATNLSKWNRIDYILLYRGNGATCKVLGTATPSFEQVNVDKVSDHRPVIVDLEKQ